MSGRLLIDHHLWLKRLHFHRLRGLWGVYLNSMFRTLGMSLVGIFIPIYIYKLTSSLPTIFIFYLIYHTLAVAMTPLAGRIMQRFGADKTAVIGGLLRTLFLGLLIWSAEKRFLLWLAAIIWGKAVSFTWLPYHYTVVVKEDGDGKFGKEVANLSIVEKITSAIAPFIGGLVIYFFSFNVLYTIGMILVMASILPLLFDQFNKKAMHFNLKYVLKQMTTKKNRPVVLGLVGSQLETQVFVVIRPLFVFLILRSVAKLGAIESVAMFLSVMVAWWTGRWVDKKGFGLMKIGVTANALALLLLPFLSQVWEFSLHNSIYLIIAVLVWTPFGAAIYELAHYQHKLEFFACREIVLHGTGALMHLLLIAFFWLGVNWWLIFGLGSLGLLLSLKVLKGVRNVQIDQGLEVYPAVAG